MLKTGKRCNMRAKQTPRERLRAEAASLEKKTKEREAKWKFTSPYQDKPARKNDET
jgi:hypothetical protein